MEKFYRHFEILDSTNQWAKENLAEFPKVGLTIVSADEQTSSYGQKKRHWLSPKGEGLWATFCFYYSQADVFVITRHMSLSILDILHQEGVEGVLKWPNDVLVNEKKMAGILTETVDGYCLVGVGWNVNMESTTLAKIDQPATSFKVESGRFYQTQELLNRLADRFIERYDIFNKLEY